MSVLETLYLLGAYLPVVLLSVPWIVSSWSCPSSSWGVQFLTSSIWARFLALSPHWFHKDSVLYSCCCFSSNSCCGMLSYYKQISRTLYSFKSQQFFCTSTLETLYLVYCVCQKASKHQSLDLYLVCKL